MSCSLCHDCLKEYLIRCLVAKCLPWSIIQAIHRSPYLIISYTLKAHSFREVLPDKTIGIFTEPPLPCMIGVCEVHRSM